MASHYSIFGSIYNQPAMKGVRKAPIKISKENRLYNPRYSYMTQSSRKSDSVSLSKNEKK